MTVAKLAAIAAVLTVSLSSCDSVIYEDLEPCVPTYNIRLAFDRNMNHENKVEKVKAANVYAFDANNKLVYSSQTNYETLQANNWVIPVQIPQGQPHRVIIWGGLTEDATYTLDGTRAVETLEDLTCRVKTDMDDKGNNISNKPLTDLFHADQTLSYTAEDGIEEHTVGMTKNNNFLRIILRKQNGSAISHNDYEFYVEEDNAVMGHDNTVIRGEKIWYHPVDRNGYETEIPDGHGGVTDVKVPAAIADLHIARLTPDSEGCIIVKNNAGEELIRADLMKLIMAVKEFEAPNMDTQEYLDCQDEFKIHLVLDENEDWIRMEIYVNGWVILYQEIEW